MNNKGKGPGFALIILLLVALLIGYLAMTQMDGHVRLIALPHLTEEEFRSVQMDDLPNYRVYEKLTGLENQGKWENRDER